MATVTEKLLTAEEFAELSDAGVPTELVRGKVVEMTSPGFHHGRICLRIARLLDEFIEVNALGQGTSNDSGVITARDPDSVRGPDLAFYSFARLPQGSSPIGYPNVAPDLIFEVLSPSDRWSLIHAKVAEYHAAGVSAVCILDSRMNRIHIYREDVPPEVIGLDDTFTIPEILPGFSFPLRRIFG